ncbi:Tudor domain-containing protein 12, partial [Stegodyphus mimosarum]
MMQKYYRSIEHSYFEIPLKDTVVIAYIDKKFYRAQVRSILNRTIGHLFRVYLVDYGRECNVPRENLYEAHKDFLTHPFQAVDFKLLGIEPAGLLLDSEDLNVSYGPVENWDVSAYKFVKDIQKVNKIDSVGKPLSESACVSEPFSPVDSVFNAPTSESVANSTIRSITESPMEELETSGSRIYHTPPRCRSSRLSSDKSSSSSNASVCSVTEKLSVVSNNSAVISPLNEVHKTKHPPRNQRIPRSDGIVNAQKQKIPENINHLAEESGINRTQECSPIKLFEEAKEKLDEQTQCNKLQGSLERHPGESQKEDAVQHILNLNKKNLPLANIASENLPKQSSVDFKKVYDFLQRQKKLSPSNLDSKCKIQSKEHSSEEFQTPKLISNTPDLKSSVFADSFAQKLNHSSAENFKSFTDNFHSYHSDNLSAEEKKNNRLHDSNSSSCCLVNEAFIGTPQKNVKQEMCTSTPVLTSSPRMNTSVDFSKVKQFILQRRKIPTLSSPSSDIQSEMSLLHHKTLKSPSVHKADKDQEYLSSNSNSVKSQSLLLQDNQNKDCVSKVDLRNVLVTESEVEVQHFNKHLSPELSPIMQLNPYPEYGSNFICVEKFSQSSLPKESSNIFPKVVETDDTVYRDKRNATVSSENADVSKASHELN